MSVGQRGKRVFLGVKLKLCICVCVYVHVSIEVVVEFRSDNKLFSLSIKESSGPTIL